MAKNYGDDLAYIHNAGYLGGLIGLIIALVHVRRLKQANRMGV